LIFSYEIIGMDQKAKKERTLAQVKLQQNLKNAGETLKARGLKAHTKVKHDLVKHRRQGKPNSEFFQELAVNIKAPRVTARKPRTTRKPTRALSTEFIEMIPTTPSSKRSSSSRTLKRNTENVNILLKKSMTLRKRADKIQEHCEKKIKKLIELAATAEKQANTKMSGTKTKLFTARKTPAPIKRFVSNSDQLATPETVEKPKNDLFIEAGKKGLTSEKGKAWHANIAKAREELQGFLKSQGINKKATGTAAVQLASIMRKDPSSAAAFKNRLLTTMKNRSQAPPSQLKTPSVSTVTIEPSSTPSFDNDGFTQRNSEIKEKFD
jgi:hypothetical protein